MVPPHSASAVDGVMMGVLAGSSPTSTVDTYTEPT